jgi:FkbM family methyltransferase
MKKFLRKIFNSLGYDIVKYNVHRPDKAKKTFAVTVGKYSILMPGNNPLVSLYKYQPHTNREIGILAKMILSKYPDASMIDIGANVGDTIAVVHTITEIPVIAVEGDPFSFSFLKKNALQFNSVSLFNQYLGEKKKTLRVSVDKDGWNNTLLPDSEGEKILDLKTLDDLLEEQKLFTPHIKLLKTDTEGFDTIILRGSKKLISSNRPVIFFEYNGENMNIIRENGYETLINLKTFGYLNVHIYDCINNLIMVTSLDNKDILQQLDQYSRKKESMIKYYDICVFHECDTDLSDLLRKNTLSDYN